MMRWLKDKKKEKRTNSSSYEEDGKEDDYGFGKEKVASKSPSSKRELPPPPAVPEEKSPHIYEEIPDLPLNFNPAGEKAQAQRKSSKGKTGEKTGGGCGASSVTAKKDISDKGDTNPYMIVPVDKEVRQTPTDFHRNGTPEVHCDVIVKDTHCEILLTRKPKVSAFRLDSSALSGPGKKAIEQNHIGNNTHFCSRNRRASVDVHSAGKLSSAFSVASSSLASSSASKVNALGASSSLSLSAFAEHSMMKNCEENDSGGSSSKGIVTYAAASSFIPRSTKLTFKPLPGMKDPRKEAFGSDSSDGSGGVDYSAIQEQGMSADGNGVCYSSVREQKAGGEFVTYTSIRENEKPSMGSADHITYTSVQDQHCSDTQIHKSICCEDQQSPLNLSSFTCPAVTTSENKIFPGAVRTGIIHAPSPSNSSSCTYATVTFPAEPKVYNTIPDLLPVDCRSTNTTETCEHDNSFQYNGNICDKHGDNSLMYSGVSPFQFQYGRQSTSHVHASRFNSNQTNSGCTGLNRMCHEPDNTGYSDMSSHSDIRNNRTSLTCMEQGNEKAETGLLTSPGSFSGNNVDIEFCSCLDDHSSTCDCSNAKQASDDDVTSVIGAANDGSSSCKSCGRLIRQITYSESYSDETYEHVYASRLLTRTGRRFSSPDITLSEVSAAEFQDIPNTRSPEFIQTYSRDDTWADQRSIDLIPPPYSSVGGDTFASTHGNLSRLEQLERQKTNRVFEWQGRHWGSKGVHPSHTSNVRLLAEPALPQYSRGNFIVHDTRKSASSSSTVTGLQTPNCSFDEQKDSEFKNRNLSLTDSLSVEYPLSSTAEQSRHFMETCADHTRKPVADQEPKSSAFTGLFSKFSRAKSSKPVKPEPPVTENNSVSSRGKQNDSTASLPSCDRELNEIPDKNTKKLSKFFQRLSSKDVPKGSSDNIGYLNISEQHARPFKTFSSENILVGSSKQLQEQHGTVVSQGDGREEGPNQSKHAREGYEKRAALQVETGPPQSQSSAVEAPAAASSTSDLTMEAAKCKDNGVVSAAAMGDITNTKPQNKTDSGDTCYEYDISTSSEGEQNSYDYFLSKVKKTLNLEHEVQHIAESSAARRKMLCKRCRKEGVYSTVDDDDDNDGLCPHLAAKFLDIKAIFEDHMVDQRAAILDCLTDYARSPYNIRINESHCCRECGCEIMTSDSESLTTVYSIMSQQYRMTSPSRQTPSCDSDEGTMADNSCDSADEDQDGSHRLCNENRDGNTSSGYDEPEVAKLERVHKQKKRRDKRSNSSSAACILSREGEKSKKKLSHGSCCSKSQQDAYNSSKTDCCGALVSKHGLKDLAADQSRKGLRKSTSMPPPLSKDDDLDHPGSCDSSRSKISMISDKILQDIYAPLPSKALSLLTSRNYGASNTAMCTCGKGLQTSMETLNAHHATEENVPHHSMKKGHVISPVLSQPLAGGGQKPSRVLLSHTSVDADSKERFAPEKRQQVQSRRPENSKPAFHDVRDVTTDDNLVMKGVDPHSGAEGQAKETIDLPVKDSTSGSLYDTDVKRSLPAPSFENSSETHAVSKSSEGSKPRSIRKSRLELAALDLLPESAVDGDEVGVILNRQKKQAISPKRSKAVEEMAKIFESHPESISKSNKPIPSAFGSKQADKRNTNNSRSPSISLKSCADDRVAPDVTAQSTSGRDLPQSAGKPLDTTQHSRLTSQRSICDASESKESKFPENWSASDTVDHLASRTRTPAARSKRDKEGETTSEGMKSDNQKVERLNETRNLRGRASKVRSSSLHSGESRAAKQKSPTPSSSSVSSSSSCKRKGGHAKSKRPSKKTYHKRRSRSRSERSKGNIGKEERTYCYLGSDVSDIDVVEVEDWETYAATASLTSPAKTSHHKKPSASRKKKSQSGNDAKSSSSGESNCRGPVRSASKSVDVNDDCEQEIYAIPPSSSEFRHEVETCETGASPQPSPEVAKARKMKRIDVYKTKKSNNKLLSDLIIRNYDMQIYGNV